MERRSREKQDPSFRMIFRADGQMAKAATGRQTVHLLVNPPWARRRAGGQGSAEDSNKRGRGWESLTLMSPGSRGCLGRKRSNGLEAAKRRKGVNPTLINTFADPVAGVALARTQSLHKSWNHAREDTQSPGLRPDSRSGQPESVQSRAPASTLYHSASARQVL